MAHIEGDLIATDINKDGFLGHFRQALAESAADMPAGPGRDFLANLIAGLGTLSSDEVATVGKAVASRYRAARREDYLSKAVASSDRDLRAGYQALAWGLRPSQ